MVANGEEAVRRADHSVIVDNLCALPVAHIEFVINYGGSQVVERTVSW